MSPVYGNQLPLGAARNMHDRLERLQSGSPFRGRIHDFWNLARGGSFLVHPLLPRCCSSVASGRWEGAAGEGWPWAGSSQCRRELHGGVNQVAGGRPFETCDLFDPQRAPCACEEHFGRALGATSLEGTTRARSCRGRLMKTVEKAPVAAMRYQRPSRARTPAHGDASRRRGSAWRVAGVHDGRPMRDGIDGSSGRCWGSACRCRWLNVRAAFHARLAGHEARTRYLNGLVTGRMNSRGCRPGVHPFRGGI